MRAAIYVRVSTFEQEPRTSSAAPVCDGEGLDGCGVRGPGRQRQQGQAPRAR